MEPFKNVLELSHCKIRQKISTNKQGKQSRYLELISDQNDDWLENPQTIRIYKKDFKKLYISLRNCIEYFKHMDISKPIITTTYLSFEISKYGKNSIRMEVSGYVNNEEIGNVYLALKCWYKPQDDEVYHCTKNQVRFNPYIDNWFEIKKFGDTFFTM